LRRTTSCAHGNSSLPIFIRRCAPAAINNSYQFLSPQLVQKAPGTPIWDADFAKRKNIKTILDTLIPEFSVRLGGATSIDVTKPGIDKAYGIKKLQETLGISVKEMIYVGDALFVGGNDYPAEQAGVISIPVRGPNETKRVIEAIIACLDDGQQARTFEVD
jgi:hydroxymethylpyrimidine pyrophosphatase-like HAD family hydrolase